MRHKKPLKMDRSTEGVHSKPSSIVSDGQSRCSINPKRWICFGSQRLRVSGHRSALRLQDACSWQRASSEMYFSGNLFFLPCLECMWLEVYRRSSIWTIQKWRMCCVQRPKRTAEPSWWTAIQWNSWNVLPVLPIWWHSSNTIKSNTDTVKRVSTARKHPRKRNAFESLAPQTRPAHSSQYNFLTVFLFFFFGIPFQ